jgi:hypothetical protein
VAAHGQVDPVTGVPFDPPVFDGLWKEQDGYSYARENWDDAAAEVNEV